MTHLKQLHEQIAAATGLLGSDGPRAALAAIQNALHNGPHATVNSAKRASPPRHSGPPAGAAESSYGQPKFVSALLTQLGVHVPGPTGLPGMNVIHDTSARHTAPVDRNAMRDADDTAQRAGSFISKAYKNQAGARNYKIYIPGTYTGQPMPLMVMLHGCTQNPDDFSAGTQMNQVAEEKQCFVVYPAQEQSANASKCWNWFKAIDQQRGQGEPSIIAGITEAVIADYGLDRDKVYIAGLSAGGAMAAIMGTIYPDVYKAVGVHSGLPYAAANDLPSAMQAMRGVAARRSQFSQASPPYGAPEAVPIIVFHGDRDTTVSATNGDRLMEDFVDRFAKKTPASATQVLVEDGGTPGRRTYTRTSHHADSGAAFAEHWVIHGAGHAWAGGSGAGSYTDASGPDASREMLRFFYTQSPDAPAARSADCE
jgi:poly(hydroxyalkanoate) depolymerase family esterase